MRFFFYGTLIAGSGNPVARLVHEKLRVLEPAQARGVLYALPDPQGWYPALLPGEGVVHGVLYDAQGDFTAADLGLLDHYEEFDSTSRETSLYVRQAVTVSAKGGTALAAQAYVYNLPPPEGACPIQDGDFREWLAFEGRHGFGSLPGSRSSA
jgi:gamma-glutamylcyclotransferase (GGCT)/AIG2-like uncharacterized protein YtfP